MTTPASMGNERLGGRAEIAEGGVWLVKSAVAGVVAGVVMAMFAMIVAALNGNGFWAPPRAITAVVFGTQHVGGGFAFGPVVVGMMAHMMLSAMFGAVYAALLGIAARQAALVTQLVAGMVWGGVLWAMNTYLVADVFLNGSEVFTSSMPAWTWFVAHLMFGGALGVLYDVWRHDRTALTA